VASNAHHVEQEYLFIIREDLVQVIQPFKGLAFLFGIPLQKSFPYGLVNWSAHTGIDYSKV
jgi:hypothetical protein